MPPDQKIGEVIPNPDPSTITAAAIDRAVWNAESRINARIDGMEKAVAVFHADLTRVPTAVDKAILSLRELLETRLKCAEEDVEAVHVHLDTRGKDITDQITHLRELAFEKIAKLSAVTDEKFTGVGGQFSERDTRTDQRAGDTKLAVDAAFAAAKEATAKIEAGFTKQIDSMINIIDTKTANLDARISDLKDSVTSLLGRQRGLGDGWGYLVAVATLALFAIELFLKR